MHPPSASRPPPQPPALRAARPALAAKLPPHYADVVAAWPPPAAAPVVYSDAYNISLFGIERLHPMDAAKFRRVAGELAARGVVSGGGGSGSGSSGSSGSGNGNKRKRVSAAAAAVEPLPPLVAPLEAPEALLLAVHEPGYLAALRGSSRKVAEVVELAPLAALPARVVDARVLAPMRYHAAGTVLAAALAMERGWAVNLGGGMHHAHARGGSGWCCYADITLAIARLRAASGGAARRVLVVDLDAHQGNGVARDALRARARLSAGGGSGTGDGSGGSGGENRSDAGAAGAAASAARAAAAAAGLPSRGPDLFIVDAYNAAAFPLDGAAKAGIDVAVELAPGAGDEEYLGRLDAALDEAARRFPAPDLVIYNAGTDVLAGDPLGRLGVTAAGILERDARVWRFALGRLGAPIVMLLSGGYTRASAGVVSDSLERLVGEWAWLGRFAGSTRDNGGGSGGGGGEQGP